MDPAAPLTDWLTSAGLSLIYLEVYEEPGGFEMDYSGASLARVGEIVVDRAEESTDPAEPGLALAAAAYVGEVLLRLAGGRWEWSGQAPAIRADLALDLPPQYPVEFVARAIQHADDDAFTQAYGQWEQAVMRYRTEHPQWTPVKQHTPGIDPDPPAASDEARLAAWIAGRQQAFPAWVARNAADGPWDFSVDSLDSLEHLLLRRVPTVGDLTRPENKELVDGALWYFGEALRRIRGGAWVYRQPDSARPGDPFAGDPFVRPAAGKGAATTPFVTIRRVVTGTRGALRARYLNWAG